MCGNHVVKGTCASLCRLCSLLLLLLLLLLLRGSMKQLCKLGRAQCSLQLS